MYLTGLWNAKLENKIGEWLRLDKKSGALSPASNETEKAGTSGNNLVEEVYAKDAFYYDLPRYLLDIIVEHQLEDEGLSDADGLGKGESPFETVSLPCVLDGEQSAEDGYTDVNGRLVCKEPEEHLFWDGFNIGAVANRGIGKEVGKMMREGRTVKKAQKEEKEKAKGPWGFG